MKIAEEILDAAPPSDFEAEAAVIGSAFFAPVVLDEISLLIDASDFWDRDHKVIYQHLLDMHTAGKRIDSKLFKAHVKKAGGELRKFEPGEPRHQASVEFQALANAMQSVPTATNAVYYAQLVREQAIKRELRHAGEMILATSHGAVDGNHALDESERVIMAIRDKRGTLTSRVRSVAEILNDAMADIAQRSTDRPPWISTGFKDLDKVTGLRKGELAILAARPSMGKTSLAMNIATNVVLNEVPVVFISLEMSQFELGDRLLSSMAGIDGNRMQTGNLSASDRTALVEASAELSRSPLMIDDGPYQTMQSIAAVCRRQKRKHGLGLVVLDYLQLITADNHRDPREQQVAKISKRLKQMARELEVPILCLAQLNRESGKRTDPRPRLSDLRESGAIEQDADVVAFVHRPEYYAIDPDEKQRLAGKAEIYIEKNRNGRTGVVPLVWMANTVTFKSMSVRECENYQPTFSDFNDSPEY